MKRLIWLGASGLVRQKKKDAVMTLISIGNPSPLLFYCIGCSNQADESIDRFIGTISTEGCTRNLT